MQTGFAQPKQAPVAAGLHARPGLWRYHLQYEQINVVIAPTTVRDRNGEFVSGLQLQDFQLYDNNKLQKVNADVRDEPLSLVVAVQQSSNLNDFLPKIQKIGTMLNQLVAGQDGEMAVVAFDHRIQVMQDFTNEGTKISEAMKKMTPGSSNHAVIDAVNARHPNAEESAAGPAACVAADCRKAGPG